MLPLLLALATPAHATDVLVPEATPATMRDFSVAYMFYDLVVSALGERGVDVESAERISAWAGDRAVGCFDEPACPGNLWADTDARLAVVMGVAVKDAGIEVTWRLYGQDAHPVKVVTQLVPNGGEGAYARELAATVADALPLFPKRPPARRAGEGEGEGKDQAEAPAATPTPAAAGTEGSDTPAPLLTVDALKADPKARAERAKMGVPWGAYVKYRQSGLARRAWLDKARVRSGRVWIGALGAYGIGDVDTGYSVRARLVASGDSVEQTDVASWRGPVAGLGVGVGGEIGYAPTWWMEADVQIAAQYGTKYLEVGWECADCTDPAAQESYEPAQAVELLAEPRLKFVFVPTGPVKPWVLVGGTLLASDGFDVPEGSVDYPDAAGAVAFGPTAGVGVGVDVLPNLSLQVELPYTYFLRDGSETTGDAASFSPPPTDFDGKSGGLLRVQVAIGARF